MSDTPDSSGMSGVDAGGLRERLPKKPDVPQQADSTEAAQDAVKTLNNKEEEMGKSEKEKKTYGRTLDGTGM